MGFRMKTLNMKLINLWESINGCPTLKITKEMEGEVKRYDSDEDLLRSGGLSIETLDRAAHGFSEGDILTINPKKLSIKWKEDYENVLWEIKKSSLSNIQWSKKINLNEPIDVSYEKGKFFIEDGHHRFVAAKILNKKLNCKLEIKDNPIRVLAPSLSYDEFHRCLFNQIMNK